MSEIIHKWALFNQKSSKGTYCKRRTYKVITSGMQRFQRQFNIVAHLFLVRNDIPFLSMAYVNLNR